MLNDEGMLSKKPETAEMELDDVSKSKLKHKGMTVDELQTEMEPADHDLFIEVVRDLVDQGLIKYDEYWVLRVVLGLGFWVLATAIISS